MAKIMDILLLLLLFVAGATSTTKIKCDELPDTVTLTNDADICEVVKSSQGIATLGNEENPLTLDFSKADETTLNTLAVGAAQSSHVLVYNNPHLDANSLTKLCGVVTPLTKVKSYIQETGLNECEFEYPLKMTTPDPSKYITPTAKFLKNCKKIKGDFIVENVNLAGLGPFELGADACLRLVNVDMKDVKITAAANTGSETCKDGRKSEITGNPNLCGDELEALHKYYKDPAAVAVKMDPATCTKPCSSDQQSSFYVLCETTTPPSTSSTIDPAASTTVSTRIQPWQIGVTVYSYIFFSTMMVV